MKRYYVTYCDRNYLVKALALMETLQRHEHRDYELSVICLDELTRLVLEQLALPNVRPLALHAIEAGDPALAAARSDRSLVEYYWTLTPTVIQWLLDNDPRIDRLTYVDADLGFFDDVEPIHSEMGAASVLIHEHRFAPALAHLIEYGRFNVGLLSFANDGRGRAVLADWRARCLQWCHGRLEEGKFGDQKYLDRWPNAFDGVHVLSHIGAGVAPWNHHQYRFSADGAKRVLVDGLPLIFYHFHSLTLKRPDWILPANNGAYPLSADVLRLCYLPYIEALERGLAAARRIEPTFACGLSGDGPVGTGITQLIRHDSPLANHGRRDLRALSPAWDCVGGAQLVDAMGLPPSQTGALPAGDLPQGLDPPQAVAADAASMAVLEQHLKEHPDDATAWNNLGVLLYRAGLPDKAMAHYEKAVALAPDNADYLKNLADFYFIAKGWPADALRLYISVLSRNPLDTETLEAMAKLCLTLDKPRDARMFYQRLMEIDPRHAEARKALTVDPGDTAKAVASAGSDQAARGGQDRPVLVSAIVSTYNAERFIRGCLEDLEAQTIADQLEIIVVDSASPQNEGAIVAEFQQRYGNIRYIRTDQRENVYTAWNRAIALARGKYLTNANTDDRHRPDAFEIMAKTLDAHPDVALVYANALITETPGETFARNTPAGLFLFLDWDRQKLLEGLCFMGPQPMWRAAVHEEYGDFDREMVTSGDYEFWLRISQTHTFLHIDQVLGLYLRRPDSIEHANRKVQARENDRILAMYRQAQADGRIIRRRNAGAQTGSPEVSIVVAAGAPAALKLCLARIAANAGCAHELIVAAGGSVPASEWQAAGLGPGRLVLSDEGMWAAVGKALKTVKGSVVVLMHDKVMVTPGWMADLTGAVCSDPMVGLVAAAVVAADPADPRGLDALAGSFKARYRHRRIEGASVVGALVAMRADLLERVGPPDPGLGGYPQLFDDWRLRVRLAGLQVVMAGDVLVGLAGQLDAGGDRGAFTAKWGGLDETGKQGQARLRLKTLDKAEKLRQQGRSDDAVDTLLEGVGRFADDPEMYCRLARILIARRQFDQALEVLNEVPDHCRDRQVVELMGSVCEGLGRLEEAGAMADEVLARHPASASALNLKGVLASGAGDMDKALAFFRQAAEADKAWGEPLANQATVLWNSDRQDEAFALYESAFVLSPTDLDIATLYHGAVAQRGAWDRAMVLVEDALALYPDCRKLAYMLVDILLNQGQETLAMDKIQQAVVRFGLDDGLAEPALKLRQRLGPLVIEKQQGPRPSVALCLIVKNEEKHLARCLASALPVVDEIVVVDTGSTDRSRQIAEIFGARVFDFAWNNDFAEARNQYLDKARGDWILVLDGDEALSALDYDKIRRTTARPPEMAFNVMTRNYTTNVTTIGWKPNLGDYPSEEAGNGWVPTWKVRLFPRDSRIRYHFPVHEFVEPSLQQMGIPYANWEVPVHHYGKLDFDRTKQKNNTYYELGIRKLAETGDESHALKELAIQAAVLERYSEAIDLWRRFLALCPDRGDAYINLSTAYFGAGRYDEAFAAAEKALALVPQMTESAYNLAVIQVHRGFIDQAIGLLENVVSREPDYQPARFVLTACCFGAGQEALAEQHLSRLMQTPLGHLLAVSFATFAKTLVKAGQYRVGRAVLEAAVARNFVNDDVLALLTQCREKATMAGTALVDGDKDVVAVAA